MRMERSVLGCNAEEDSGSLGKCMLKHSECPHMSLGTMHSRYG